MNKENMKLNLICKTWNIESFGLYDYHLSIDKQIIDLNIEKDIEVFRIANKIYTNTYISQGYLGIKGFKNFEYKQDLLFTIYTYIYNYIGHYNNLYRLLLYLLDLFANSQLCTSRSRILIDFFC